MTPHLIETAVRTALVEDAPWGDLTAEHLIDAGAHLQADLMARTDGVLAGGQVFAAAFTVTDPATQVDVAPEGTRFSAGDRLASVQGPARAILTAERVALNFAQRLCAIATLTDRYVQAVAGTGVRIADTRKTTPGLRALERHAVRVGGGHSHRFGLSDAVMVKDNHLAVLTAAGINHTEALRDLRASLGHTTHVVVEVDRLEQVEGVLDAGADTVLLDNFPLDDLREAVHVIDGRAVAEASGGISLQTVAQVAATGVDVISVGALTHSVAALDLGLDVGSRAGARTSTG